MVFDKRTLVLPDETQFQERLIVTRGDVVVGDFCDLAFGFETPDRVFVGERATLGGPVDAGGDVRVDLSSRIEGDVSSMGSVFLGERAHVAGKLSVEMDLDVGDDVKIDEGFEARGWINIRNPIPLVVYLFIYLLQLMGQGRGEEVERILQELEGDADAQMFTVSDVFLFIPGESKLGLQESTVKGGLRVGRECRVLGNFTVKGDAKVGPLTKFHGALHAAGDVRLDDFVEVHGDLVSDGKVTIGNGCHIFGNVRARQVELKQTALVDGNINADEGLRFLTDQLVEVQEKLEDFEAGKEDILDLLD